MEILSQEDLLVNGYLKDNCVTYIPYVLIQQLKSFFDFDISCKMYNSSNKITINDDNIIRIYPCCNTNFAVTDQDKLLLPECFLTKIHKSDAEFMGTKDVRIVSKGMWNDHAFICTKDNELYGVSFNGFGNFSFNDSDFENMSYRYIPFNRKEIISNNIVQIQCGQNHTLFLDIFGDVFGYGSNTSYQLTNEFDTKNGFGITKLNSLCNIKRIGCGKHSSFALNRDGILHTFGKNINGILGISRSYMEYNSSGNVNILQQFRFKYIDVISFHIGCISINGELYMWGNNSNGECGYKYRNNIIVPTKLSLNIGCIINVKCGAYHTIIKNDINEYYAFGDNDQECLLLKNCTSSTKVPPTMIDKSHIYSVTGYTGDIIDLIPGYETTYIMQML